MNNRREILKNLYHKYWSSFKYQYKKSHQIFLEDMLMFSLEDKNINILNSLKGVNYLDYERDVLERIIVPKSEKFEILDLDEYDKKCLFVLGYVYMMKKCSLKGV